MEDMNFSPLTKPLIFDSHAHYDDERLLGCGDELFTELSKSVAGILTCSCDFVSCETAKSLAEKYEFLYFAAGIHPENVGSIEGLSLDAVKQKLTEFSQHKKCVAIGEIGLDYYWTQDNIPLQRETFSAQLELGNALSMPVIIHDRDAHADTLEMLKRYKPKGVVHSYSGSAEMAKEIYKLGLYIGISGVITFKNAKKLPDVVKEMPLDRFLLETDAPYLAPVPFRGKTNNSSLIYYSAEKIGEIKGISTEDVPKYAMENTQRLYSL